MATVIGQGNFHLVHQRAAVTYAGQRVHVGQLLQPTALLRGTPGEHVGEQRADQTGGGKQDQVLGILEHPGKQPAIAAQHRQ